VSAAYPAVVKELSGLLRRYRDGGYSRELPPPGVSKKTSVAVLPPLPGQRILDEALTQMPVAPWVVARGKWGAENEGVWGAQDGKDTQGATLRVPVEMMDGVVEYEIRFDGAGRHSLRVEWGRREGSFRFEISRTMAGITKNPSVGEDARAVQPLAQKTLKLEPQQWYPVRITFDHEKATLQVNETVVTASHAVIGNPKSVLNFLVFGRDVGFRNVRAAR
jgi:hypothetical protein